MITMWLLPRRGALGSRALLRKEMSASDTELRGSSRRFPPQGGKPVLTSKSRISPGAPRTDVA